MDSELVVSLITAVVVFSLLILLISNTATSQALKKRTNKRERYILKVERSIIEPLKKHISHISGTIKGQITADHLNFKITVNHQYDGSNEELVFNINFINNLFIENLQIQKTYSDRTFRIFRNEELRTNDTDFDKKFVIKSIDENSHLCFTNDVRNSWTRLHDATDKAYCFELNISTLEIIINTKKFNPTYLKNMSRAIVEAALIISENNSEEIVLKKTIEKEVNPIIVNEVCNSLKILKKDNTDMNLIIESLKNRPLDIQIAAAPGLFHFDEDYFLDIIKNDDLDPNFLAQFLEKISINDISLLKNLFLKHTHPDIKKEIILNFYKSKNQSIFDFLIEQFPKETSAIKKELLSFFIKKGDVKLIEKLYILSQNQSGSEKNKILKVIKVIQSGLKTGEAGWVSIQESNILKGNLSVATTDGELSLKKES